MNFNFSLSHDNFVVETVWFGDLSSEIISTGLRCHNNWAIRNLDKFPLILLSDYSKADLNRVSRHDLQSIADQFIGINDLFPDATWVAIMPHGVKYTIVRLWQIFSENLCANSTVVRNRQEADKIISRVLMSYMPEKSCSS